MALAACAHGRIAGECTVRPAGTAAMVPVGAQWLVPVKINGGDWAMALDTGAGATVLARTAVAGLDLGAAPVHFEFAGTDRGRVTLPVADLRTPQSGPLPVAGVLGLPSLHGYDLQFDFVRQTLSLYQRADCDDGRPDWDGAFTEVRLEILRSRRAGAVSPDTPEVDGMLFNVAVNGRTFTALLDTGAERTTINADAAALSGMSVVGTPVMTADASGRFLEMTRIAGNRVRVGDMNWVDVALNVTQARFDLGVDMLFGQDLMRGRRVWAMLGAQKLFWQRA